MFRVYEGTGRGLAALLLCAGLLASTLLPAHAQGSADPLADARKALRGKDRKALALARNAAIDQQHPLASWIDYWEIGQRLAEVSQPELEAFYARWPGSYVEDRLRNDWLLELGRRRDWKNLAADYPRFRMNDDREVSCYALLTEHLAGRKVTEAARAAWLAQRDQDDGCNLLATTLFDAKQFTPADAWMKLRLAMENNRPRAVRQSAALLGKPTELAVADINDGLARYLARKAGTAGRNAAELTTLALIKQAGAEPESAADILKDRFDTKLPADLRAWAWAQIGKQSALKLQTEAAGYYERALAAQATLKTEPEWSDDTLAWLVRSALRADRGTARWPLVLRGISLMSEKEQRESTWVYWRARALLATAEQGERGDPQRHMARGLLQTIASPMHFYGKLAGEDLGAAMPLPPVPTALTPVERSAAATNPGLSRGLLLISQGLRNEGVREWNFSLRGMGDRELLAAAQMACDREVWDRCINASDRTRNEIDLAQRFPTPFRTEVTAKARDIGLDPAYVYGLIRQESRFIMDAQSHVGAAGLMQVMPSTAKWVAKKSGFEYRADALNDRDFNLKLGTSYLKLVLDDFGGSMAMAAAAYNAGPSRPRRWRDGPVMDAAIWAENIPFNETRDYVKKVLSNTTIYGNLLNGQTGSLRERLGKMIGPREATASASNLELP